METVYLETTIGKNHSINTYTGGINGTSIRRKFMRNDPIVEEIHRVREKMLEECRGDLERLMDRIKVRESNNKDWIVSTNQVKEKKGGKLGSGLEL